MTSLPWGQSHRFSRGDFAVVLRDGTKVAGSRCYRAAFDMLTR